MAVNYASGLSSYVNRGCCGMPELYDDVDTVCDKSSQLAALIRDSRHLVVITGAGLSTAAGIPDFRGPAGVWTLEEKGESPNIDVTFDTAAPTVSHLTLVALEHAGLLKFLVSQNVDGLHVRSGFPCNHLAELHGNMFIEQCNMCRTQYVRSTVVPSMKQQLTGRVCTQTKQRGKCRQADLCLCLGTSLQIFPCASLPLMTKKAGGRVVIVNLQATRLDSHVDLVIHDRVDVVMTKVCEKLRLSPTKWDNPHVVPKSRHTQPDELQTQLTVDSSLLDCCKQ